VLTGRVLTGRVLTDVGSGVPRRPCGPILEEYRTRTAGHG